MHLADVAHQLLGAHCPAETPAGHRVGLGEAVHHDGALLHAGQFGKADVRVLAIGQAAIDLVRQHNDIGLADDGCDRLQLVPRHDRAGRVVGVGQDEQLGARRDRGTQRLGGELELVLHPGGQRDGDAARHLGQRGVAHKAWLRDEHLVARVDQHADGVVDRLRTADRDQDLLVRIIAQLVFAAHECGNLAAQLGKAPVGRVKSLSLFKGLDARAADLPRGLKVGLSHAE